MKEKHLTSYSEHYCEISKDNIIKFFELKDDYKKAWEKIECLEKKLDEDWRDEESKEFDLTINDTAGIKNDMDAAGHITIIFSAMCLEAIINNYAIKRTSNNYFNKYLDKLDLKAKWRIIPKLLVNAEFNSDSQAFELLTKVIKSRNELVHYKSREIKFDQNIEQMEKNGQEFLSNVKDSFKAIFLVVEELNRIDPNWKDYKWYKFLLKENPDIIKFV